MTTPEEKSSPREQYNELVNLTQQYLRQTFSSNAWETATPEGFAFFKKYALEQRVTANTAKANRPIETHTHQAVPNNAPPISRPVTPIAPAINTQMQAQEMKPSKPAQEFVKDPALSKSTLDEHKSAKTPKKPFELEPFQSAITGDLSDIRNLLKQHFPSQTLLENPLEEEKKQSNEHWLEESMAAEVLILSNHLLPRHQTLLNNLLTAIKQKGFTGCIVPVHQVEQNNLWKTLLGSKHVRLFIANDQLISSISELSQQYHPPSIKNKVPQLNTTPLCLLGDLSSYLREPTLKLPLWNAIIQLLKLGCVPKRLN